MPLPKLLGWVKRAEEIGTVLAAILAGYIAWDKVALEHERYGAIIIAAVLASFAAWVILGWFGVIRGPTFGIDELKSKILVIIPS
jgi:hypothetical protein